MDNADILGEIFGWIDRGSTYKAITLVCRQFRDVAAAAHPTADTKFAHHLKTLIKFNPDWPWDWQALCANPYLDADYILANAPEDKRCWAYLNPAIPLTALSNIRYPVMYKSAVNLYRGLIDHGLEKSRGLLYSSLLRHLLTILWSTVRMGKTYFSDQRELFQNKCYDNLTWKDFDKEDTATVAHWPFDARV